MGIREVPTRRQPKIAFRCNPDAGGTQMPAPDAIAPARPGRIVGTSRAPLRIDLRSGGAFAVALRLLPGAIRADDRASGDRPSIALCQAGRPAMKPKP
jgi:hypothetical protein